MTKRNLRGKGLFQLGKLGQMLKVGIFSLLDLKQRQWRDASYWLAFPDLLNLLPYTTQNHLSKGRTTAHSGLILPIPIVN